MKSRLRPSAAVSLLLVLVTTLTAGCGGGGSTATSTRAGTPTTATTSSAPTTSSTPLPRGPLSRAELVAQADAICKRVNAEIQLQKSQSRGRQETERLAQHNLTVERTALTSLAKLHSTKSVEPGWRRVLSDRRTLEDELGELVDNLRRNDQKAINALALTKQLAHTTLQEDATRIGLKDCAVVK
jgi:hypothetical protein